MPLTILMQEKITQTSGANSEQTTFQSRTFVDVKGMNNYFLVAAPLLQSILVSKTQKTLSLSIVSSVTCTNQSL